MSRVLRYQESIIRFIKKNDYTDIIRGDKDLQSLIDEMQHEPGILFLTVMNSQCKKKKAKTPNGYYLASGINMLLLCAIIYDNLNYYEQTYSQTLIRNFISQVSIYFLQSYAENIETLENNIEDKKLDKIQKKMNTIIYKRISEIVSFENLDGQEKVHKTDIIKYKFKDDKMIDKYRKLKIVDKEKLLGYVERKYGNICQCAFLMGWLYGLSDDKMIGVLENMGVHLGMLIKLANDFSNIERDIKYVSAKNNSYNLIVNFGIHECFKLFDESKCKLLEGCITLDIYNFTIKEIIDNVEKKFDNYLKNTDLELASRYSSFSSQ